MSGFQTPAAEVHVSEAPLTAPGVIMVVALNDLQRALRDLDRLYPLLTTRLREHLRYSLNFAGPDDRALDDKIAGLFGVAR